MIYTTHPDQEPPKCPKCTFTSNLYCTLCGSNVYACQCLDWNEWYCFSCDEEFTETEGIDLEGIDPDSWEKLGVFLDVDDIPSTGETVVLTDNEWVNLPTKKAQSHPSHEHKHQALLLPNEEVTIHCSQLWNDRPEAQQPDFGLYAEVKWNPIWRNEFINWPDYSIPKNLNIACEQISSAYEKAVDGSDVEIGCWGGHGRTGTILACMVLLAMQGDWTPEQATAWVKTSYCGKAIEVDEQKWFIKFFSNKYFGTELPEFSTVKHSKSPSLLSIPHGNSSSEYSVGSNCSVRTHYAMYLRGHRKCANKDACRWWATDLENFESDKVPTPEPIDKELELYELKFSGKVIDSDFTRSHDQTQHYAMFKQGWESCALLGADCGYWEEDFEMFTEHPHLIDKWVDEDVAELLLEDYPHWSGTINVRKDEDQPVDPD